MSRPILLVINLGFEQHALIKAAAELGARIAGIHYDDQWDRRLPIDEVKVCDLRDLPAILDIARQIRPDGVAADECDYSFFACAIVSEELGLPGPGIASAQRATNKWLQRRALKEFGGVAQPDFELVADENEAHAAAALIGFPVIVKPIDNRGGIGIRRVDTAGELSAALRWALANAPSRLALVERLIVGTQMVVDGYCFPRSGFRDLTISSKRMAGQSHVASDIVTPAEVPQDAIDAVRAVNAHVVAGLGINYGMTHAEYIVDAAGVPYLVELANRGGGVLISAHYVPSACGLKLQHQMVYDALGQGRDLWEETADARRLAVWMRFLVLPTGSQVTAISGVDTARRLPGIEAFWLKAVPGTVIPDSIRDDLDRQGFVIASGRTRSDAERAVQQFERTLQIETVAV
jgi:biotin carboxylase